MPRELEEGLEHGGALDGVVGEQAPVQLRDGLEEVPPRALDVGVLETAPG